MELYQHFRKEEQPFIDQVMSWKEDVEQKFEHKITDFLDPREQQILLSLIGDTNDDINVYLDGGSQNAERRRAVIAPFYERKEREAFQLSLLQASYANKFVNLTHRDVMGAFLSLGIKRKKLGDIFIGDGLVQIIAANEITPYVTANLTAIKKAKISLEEKPFSMVMEKKVNWLEQDKTVSSLRLDTVIKEIYNLSRKDAALFISKQQVKVNFKIEEDAKYRLQSGDMLSIRGKGRSKVVSINGSTKKDKLKITVALLK
ncbi:RNA-binding protein [Virgibacillus halodenitrificans]|uniref:YlmH family RNA-binding protein n=1 Tax=Virgibacillus halodenitrificans TaxID=1482 RepID=UPI00136D1B97|nr:YlmH/Sll1252 family protein [Virgibacillus halodenitrificans]MYL46575.1 RNA-binding protein [Virgibacillus halodenitrificans]